MSSEISPKRIKVVLLEDNPRDAETNLRELRRAGFDPEWVLVETEETFLTALEPPPDLIISDFSLPQFDGLRAVDLVRGRGLDTPFILVSGTLGEEVAVGAMRRGVDDYLLKASLLRLGPSVASALEKKRLRDEQKKAEDEKRRTDEQLRLSSEMQISILNALPAHIAVLDSHGVIVTVNAAWRHFASANVLQSADFFVGQNYLGVCESAHGECATEAQAVAAGIRKVLSGELKEFGVEYPCHSPNEQRWFRVMATPLSETPGTGAVVMHVNVTERMQQALKIQRLARIHAVLGAHGTAVLRAHDAVQLLDTTCQVAVKQGGFKAAAIRKVMPDNTLPMVSSFGDVEVLKVVSALGPLALDGAQASGRLPAEVVRQRRRIFVQDYAQSDLSASIREEKARLGIAAQIALPIGDPPWAVLSLFSAVPQEFDREEIALLEQLTAEIDYAHDFIAKTERLAYLAYHDAITGLPNRARFQQWIGPALEIQPHVIALVDVVRFRQFESGRGHTWGEHLLRAVGERITSSMPAGAMLFHLGQDQFLYACPETETLDMARMDAAVAGIELLLLATNASPISIQGEEVTVRLHASVMLAPSQGDSAESIERNLVAVLAESQKREEPVLVFTEDLGLLTSRRSAMEHDLRAALATGGFELFLQPKFNAVQHDLTGAEALLRWRHPDRGLISPAEFIPVLEESGLIVEVGAWVRREGLAIWQRWRELGHGGLRLAVNVSARELRHSKFLEDCSALLASHQGRHGLDVEVTESMMMEDIGKCIDVLNGLRGLGCKIHIDDFGTGYSSLNYLSRLPVNTLKIDQSFTAALASSADALALVSNIISLAHSLGLTVVAEGVEGEEQAKLLRLLRCNELQGYHLGRPMPAAEFEKKLLT